MSFTNVFNLFKKNSIYLFIIWNSGGNIWSAGIRLAYADQFFLERYPYISMLSQSSGVCERYPFVVEAIKKGLYVKLKRWCYERCQFVVKKYEKSIYVKSKHQCL